MEITYDYYRIFYYVAKYKSFSKAATILMGSQPNISRFMSNLESQLGCKLFIRSNRGVALTLEGQKLYHHVSIAFQHLQAAEMELAQDRSLEHGILTLSASEIALHLLLLPVLSKFHQTYPGIRLRISNHSTPEAIQAVKSGTADLAVVSTPTDIHDPLRAQLLMKASDILVGNRQYDFLTKEPVHLAEIARYPLICLGRHTTTYEFYYKFYLEHGLILSPDTEVATVDQIPPMILHNLGIGFLPEKLARDAISQGKVVKIPLIEQIPQRDICLIEDRSAPLSIAANALKQMLLSCVGQSQSQDLSSI